MGGVKSQLSDLLKTPKNPTIAIINPPVINQTVLSVGDPVKKREMSELSEFEALVPYTIKIMPAARSALEMVLFISFSPGTRAWIPDLNLIALR